MGTLVEGFQHVATLTNDLDRLVAFYVEVFGARQAVTLEGGPDAPFTRHALVEIADGVVLHPFERPEADLDRWGSEIFERGRTDHYAIRARDRAAFEELRRRLVARGASDGEVTDFGALLSVGFVDPDGTRLEVCWFDEAVGLAGAREPEGFVARRHGARASAPARPSSPGA